MPPSGMLLLQLFLGWALLLGRPVCGVVAEEEEFEEQWSLLEEDLEDPPAILEGEEEEEAVASEELEERIRGGEVMVESNPGMKEELMDHFSAMAMDYFNKHSYGLLYKVLDEDRSLTFKKAIGVMVYLRLFLGKTNCTNSEMGGRSVWHISDFLGRMSSRRHQPLPELRRCVLPPPSEREALDCTFDIFLNARTHWEKVMGHQCKRLEIEEPDEFYNSVE